MRPWLLFSLLTLLCWGFWGFFSKAATTHISPQSVLVYELIGSAIVGFGVLVMIGFKPETQPMGILFAVLTGMCLTLGMLFFLLALSRGTASMVTVMTALYPLVTVLLLFLLYRDPLTARQLAGMVLGCIAMILFAL